MGCYIFGFYASTFRSIHSQTQQLKFPLKKIQNFRIVVIIIVKSKILTHQHSKRERLRSRFKNEMPKKKKLCKNFQVENFIFFILLKIESGFYSLLISLSISSGFGFFLYFILLFNSFHSDYSSLHPLISFIQNSSHFRNSHHKKSIK